MQTFNDFVHRNFGTHIYRPSIKVRTDAFYEYLPSEDAKDQLVLSRLSNTIVDLTDLCFQACVDPSHKYFTYSQKNCVSKCVKDYFNGFEKVVEETLGKIRKQKQSNNLFQFYGVRFIYSNSIIFVIEMQLSFGQIDINLNKHQQANLKNLFTLLDIDGLGQIEVDSLFQFFRKMDKRITSEYCDRVFFCNGRKSQNCLIDFSQFAKIFLTIKKEVMAFRAQSIIL